jgi:hypothetical protein
MPDMIVASTTATQEEMDHAVSPNWREPFQTKAPEPKPEVAEEPVETEEEVTEETPEASEETETAPVPEAEEEQESTVERPTKGKGGFQKKIDKLTREKGEAAARALALEEELQELRNRLAKPAVTEEKSEVKTSTRKRPAESEIGTVYKSYEEFQQALIRFEAAELLEETLAKRDQEAREREAREIQEERDHNYREAAKEFAEQTPDFNDAIVAAGKAGMKLPEPIIDLIKELPNGPAVTYYLVQNPDEALTVMQASPAMGFAMVGRISQGLEAKPEPAKTTPAKKPTSSAPPPAKPVAGHSARSSTPLSEMSTDEFIAARNKAERERRRYP